MPEDDDDGAAEEGRDGLVDPVGRDQGVRDDEDDRGEQRPRPGSAPWRRALAIDRIDVAERELQEVEVPRRSTIARRPRRARTGVGGAFAGRPRRSCRSARRSPARPSRPRRCEPRPACPNRATSAPSAISVSNDSRGHPGDDRFGEAKDGHDADQDARLVDDADEARLGLGADRRITTKQVVARAGRAAARWPGRRRSRPRASVGPDGSGPVIPLARGRPPPPTMRAYAHIPRLVHPDRRIDQVTIDSLSPTRTPVHRRSALVHAVVQYRPVVTTPPASAGR